jgi:hypothetical protein
VVRPDAGQGVITVYGFFTPLRIAIKCLRTSHIDEHETKSSILELDRLPTSIHALFTELA